MKTDAPTRLFDLNDLTSLSALADELKMNPSTLRMAARTPERRFPEPVHTLGKTPGYSRKAVMRWFADNYK